MSAVRAVLVTLMLSCLVFAEARGILQDVEAEDDANATGQRSTTDCGGDAPVEGDYVVRHIFPSAPDNDTIVEQSRSIISLRRVLDNVYQGYGGGVASTPELEFLQPGQPIVYSFIAIWTAETCTLSGTLYDFPQGLTDPVALVYDGESTIEGAYVNTVNSTVPFSTSGILSLSLYYPY